MTIAVVLIPQLRRLPGQLGTALAEFLQPAPHVEWDNRGRGVRDPAHCASDLVSSVVVQQPPEQGREAPPGQDHRDPNAGQCRLVAN